MRAGANFFLWTVHFHAYSKRVVFAVIRVETRLLHKLNKAMLKSNIAKSPSLVFMLR